MKTLCIDPPTTKQLAILVLSWMNKRSSIETTAGKMSLLNITGQFIQQAFYGALCITLTNNHMYAENLNSVNIEKLAIIGLAIFTLFISPVFGVFNGTIQSGRPHDEISIGELQGIVEAGAFWFDVTMDELGIREMISVYFENVYRSLIMAVHVDNSTRIDHHIFNITQLMTTLMPINHLSHFDPQGLILKLRMANDEERIIATKNNIVSGEIIALKVKPILNINFINTLTNPVKMATFIPGQVYGLPQPTVYTAPVTMPPSVQNGIQVLPSTNQPQQPIQISQQPLYTLQNGQQVQGGQTVHYVSQTGQPLYAGQQITTKSKPKELYPDHSLTVNFPLCDITYLNLKYDEKNDTWDNFSVTAEGKDGPVELLLSDLLRSEFMKKKGQSNTDLFIEFDIPHDIFSTKKSLKS